MNEKEKMEENLWYDANNDKDLIDLRSKAKDLCHKFNISLPSNEEYNKSILKKLIPNSGDKSEILAPFYTDYGIYIEISDNVFINHNAYFMDGGGISIGENTYIGPNCGIYTGSHPLVADERNLGLEKASPVTIGSNVWIGADVTILPGVTIGSGSVIGAKSLVVKDIGENVIAVGNPCKPIRPITSEDRILIDRKTKK